ncbi:hypothetical protein ALC62_08023 [Cyphomyrmex costatus]|uniref:Uncharacterized protein n=1 Tax=Cyphomyrmex costatus TaxID=456900 RepID=A0A195CKD3_9HYME|nr:hypothetical protein ALC62_08023 [Cyphomyrmex costatus]
MKRRPLDVNGTSVKVARDLILYPAIFAVIVRNPFSPWKFTMTKRYTPQNSLPFVVRYIAKVEGFKVYTRGVIIIIIAQYVDNICDVIRELLLFR